MREFQEKKHFKKILYSKGMVVVLLILILFFARATWGVYQKQRDSAANVVRAHAELAKLNDREQLLKKELTRLNTDEGVEEEIRSKFGVSKPGEEMIIIVDPAGTGTVSTTTPENWWIKFKKLFK